jgi:2OG-Fe(II) oxygenase superfamily
VSTRPVSSIQPAELEGFEEVMEVDHPDLFTVPGFASSDECRELIQAWHAGSAEAVRHDHAGPWGHFDARVVRTSPNGPAAPAIRRLAHAAAAEVTRRWGCQVRVEPPQLVVWPAPHGQWWHKDVPPKGDDGRRFSSILYLNDGFTGGCTCFRDLGLKVRPAPGTLLSFRFDLFHGVENVTDGERYTLATWHKLA